MRLTVVMPDLDVDSNNDGTINGMSGPDGTDDRIEAKADLSGKILAVNDDHDEGKVDGAGQPMPDYADDSPVSADGTALVTDDMAPCNRAIWPWIDGLFTDATVTLNQISGPDNAVRVWAVQPNAVAPFVDGVNWVEVPVVQGEPPEIPPDDNLRDSFYLLGSPFRSAQWYIEGLAPGEVVLQLTFQRNGCTCTDKVKLTVAHAEVRSIEVTSDHGLLMKNPTQGSVWGDSSEAFETPEWLPSIRNNPTSQTKGTALVLQATVAVTPPGLSFNLVGDSPAAYLDFQSGTYTSTGGDQVITLNAAANLPDQVRVLNEPIHWAVQVGTAQCDAGTSGPHKIYVTYGTPTGSVPHPNVPTDTRVSWSSERCAGQSDLDGIVLAAHARINTDKPPYFYGPTDEWPAGTPPIWMMLDATFAGGSCIAHSNLLQHAVNILGVPGGSLVRVYASTNTAFDTQEMYVINARDCTVVVVVDHGGVPEANYYEGCLEINSRYYPGAYKTSSFASKHAVHSDYAAWPNRLVYVTVDDPRLYYDKDRNEYTNPLDIPSDLCIPVP